VFSGSEHDVGALRNPFIIARIYAIDLLRELLLLFIGKRPMKKVIISRSQQGHYPSFFEPVLNSDLLIYTYLVYSRRRTLKMAIQVGQ